MKQVENYDKCTAMPKEKIVAWIVREVLNVAQLPNSKAYFYIKYSKIMCDAVEQSQRISRLLQIKVIVKGMHFRVNQQNK